MFIFILLSDGKAVERICLSSAEVTNTWPLDIICPSAGGVEAVHAAEDESSLHLAFSSGLYAQLHLGLEGALSSVQTNQLSSMETKYSSWHWQWAKWEENEKQGEGSLFLFGVSSQGKDRNTFFPPSKHKYNIWTPFPDFEPKQPKFQLSGMIVYRTFRYLSPFLSSFELFSFVFEHSILKS